MTRQIDHDVSPVIPGAPEGTLINVISVDRADLAEFDSWYSTEHFPERLAVSGFRTARRFVEHPDRGRGLVEFLSIYETDCVDTLTSSEYLAALDSPTPRTTAAVALFRENERTVGRLHYRQGFGRTGEVLLGRITCTRDDVAALVQGLTRLAGTTIDSGSADGVTIYESDPIATSAKDDTAEGQAVGDLREASEVESTVALFVIVERHGSLAPAPVGTFIDAVSALGPPVRWSTYRLVSAQQATSSPGKDS
ncbi:hypothetical protein HQ325_09155 [Rhodococcus sp. BP-349]|uniref:hypothetical protein n=1 Tax=unclassified Rhodococcus (in: high G+C Gram-positive bacteria) TaxID=192944 RepID=UPI001C9A45DA|nr:MULTISPECIES: hypothetical protein [unclassified Rhodococcus (in: high G+C Gram-positive bacteria)]MBY6538838.1 hypothetical protein [Rhodococcus sp. BP-363]MBY6543175.1 hypothetical protein [Rhodococcus sp. BP-369]MBY6562405.1 hypothetical protein [Rhodococcus sp. BP-370]MBY6576697.1 hypothetical protein [Rhodococcus sp. BP-364]MBY6585998.1 hypothetical protein [Rhodococcus sp. BP-358]